MLSSLAVVGAAGYAFKVWKESGARDRSALILIGLIFVIGINSALFHSVRSLWLYAAETAPIVVLVLLAFGLVLMRLFRQSVLLTAVHLLGFFFATLMVTLMLTPKALGNGAAYVVPLIALYMLGTILILRARMAMHEDRILMGAAAARSNNRHFPELKTGYALVQVGVLLALGLLARAYDISLCKYFPIGLHMVWHLVIAIALLVLTLAIIRHTRPVAQRASDGAETGTGPANDGWPPKNRLPFQQPSL